MNEKTAPVQPNRPARLVDVAREANVSRTTVAKVLLNTGGPNTRTSPQVAERIRDIAMRLNYRSDPIAQKLKGAKSMCFGVLVGYGRANNMLYRLLDIEEFAYERGYRVQMSNAQGDLSRAIAHIDDFERQRLDGIIGLHLPASFGESFFSRIGRPTVYQGMFAVPGGCNVMLDRASGVEKAVSHLVEFNRQRIGMVLSGVTEEASVSAKIEGFNRGLLMHGRPNDPRWIITRSSMLDLQKPDVVRQIIDLKLDALICSSDSIAIPLMRLLHRAGRSIPRDIAIVGFDNMSMAAWLDPSLTSIDQNDRLVAKTTVDRLIQKVEYATSADAAESVTWIQPRLVIRESTGGSATESAEPLLP